MWSSISDLLEYFGGIRWCLFFVLFGLVVYHCVFKTWSYFSIRNVKFIRGIPLLGSTYQHMIGLENASRSYERCYEAYPNERFIGLYDLFGKPKYLIRDPDLIKQLFITDIDHFLNHTVQFGEIEPLFSRSLLGMQGERWKRMRATLSPAFTSRKMRLMHHLMVETTEEFIQTLKKVDNENETVNARDIFSRYACDIIASCAFGLKINSINDPTNEFYKAGLAISSPDALTFIKLVALLSAPKLMQWLDIPILDRKVANYFRGVVSSTIRERIEKNIVRNDMIDLLIKAREGKLNDEIQKDNEDLVTDNETNAVNSSEKVTAWTDDDLVAQCLIFFAAGFQTVTNVLGFMVHELAINPDIENRAYKEVLEVKQELNGQPLNYEALQKLKYLSMVVNETLRKWTPATMLERLCTKPYVIENTDGTKVQLNPGDEVWVSISGIQKDEQYFPYAEHFDPERFSDEKKDSIRVGTFIPFWIGPRNCIGSRFALMQIKTLAYYLLSEFVIDRSLKTQDPIQLKRGTFNLEAQNGFWIDLRRRR